MIEVLKQALEAFEQLDGIDTETECVTIDVGDEIASLRQAIAELESQEPVAYINVEQRKLEWAKPMSWNTPTTVKLDKISLYTHPPQRKEKNNVK
jgi:hypothetical protein